MRSFKEFLEEELISEDDDKKEDKKESKKDSEKKGEKKDEDKKEDKKKEDKKEEEEEIVLSVNDGYTTSLKIVFGPEEYEKHLNSLDEDDDEYEEKIKPMVYIFSFGGKYQAKFESSTSRDTVWLGTLNKAIPSDTKEQGLVLSTIMEILDDFGQGVDKNLAPSAIKVVNFELPYSDEKQLENYKKMQTALHVPGYSVGKMHTERLKKYHINLVK